MGGAVSSGRDNNELVDNLKEANFIRTRDVELAFRAVDRGDYLLPEFRQQAYKDLAWRSGPLHMSAPCIYSEVMESLELQANQSFLNVGSGTGYLSTMAGLLLGSGGINHGVEIYQIVVDYAHTKLKLFLEQSHALNEFDFAEPKFFVGDGLCLAPLQSAYDRVYCGAGCPDEYQNYFKQLVKVGGILVMPLNTHLIQMRRISLSEWSTRNVLSVQFSTLRVPQPADAREVFRIDDLAPPRLQALARGAVRSAVRQSILTLRPELAPTTSRQLPRKVYPKRLCIPVAADSDNEQLNALHDLDRDGGANEMNALLNLVISMGSDHVAGAIRFDTLDSASDSSDPDTDDSDDDDQQYPIDDANQLNGDESSQENGVNGHPKDNAEEIEAKSSQSNAKANKSDKLDEAINNSVEDDTTEENSNKTSHNKNETSYNHINGNSSPKAGCSRSNLESERADETNESSNSQSNPSTSQSHQPSRSETMSELCDRTIYRALTGHDRPANSNESEQATRGKLLVTLEYNDPADLVNVNSSSTEEGQQPSKNTNKQRRNRKRRSQTSLNCRDDEESDSTKTDTAPEKSSDFSEDEGLPVTSTSQSQGKGKAKRQKLDSGIGDGDTPSTSSPSSKHDTKELNEDIKSDEDDVKTETEDEDATTSDSSASSSGQRNPRPIRIDPRRVELTALTSAAIRDLPLPLPLKLYLNMGRPFSD